MLLNGEQDKTNSFYGSSLWHHLRLYAFYSLKDQKNDDKVYRQNIEHEYDRWWSRGRGGVWVEYDYRVLLCDWPCNHFFVTQHLPMSLLHMNLKQVFVKLCKKNHDWWFSWKTHILFRLICDTHTAKVMQKKHLMMSFWAIFTVQWFGYRYDW